MTPQLDRRDVAFIREDVARVLPGIADLTPAFEGATVLVTGGGGMIGGYVADVLIALNDHGALRSPLQLVVATRKVPGPTDRLAHLVARNDVVLVVPGPSGDWVHPDRLDYVVYAASPASPTNYLVDPIGTLDANSRHLRSALVAAHQGGARGFVYLSTSEVYGNPPMEAIPTPETFVGSTDSLSERASYVEAKRFGEALSLAYHRQLGLPVSIVRPFHVHGPGLRLDDGRIIASLMAAGLDDTAFTLASDGSATRCYGYVADAVVGIIRALLHGRGEAFNIGVDEPETSILTLAGLVANIAGSPPPLVSPSAGPVHLAGAPLRSRPDLSKAREVLAYQPVVDLEDGLRRTFDWFRARQAIPA